MSRWMQKFAIGSLVPGLLVLAAAAWGGGWSVLALAVITVTIAAIDHVLIPTTPPDGHPDTLRSANRLSVLVALLHFAVLICSVGALSSGRMGALEGLALFLATGLFIGQISNSNAHELIHRSDRTLRWLGKGVYISVLFGHHASAHVLVHHVHVATARDPNSARLGENFWWFAQRAWVGSFRAGLAAETARMRRVDRPVWAHPYVSYIAGGVLWAVLMVSLFGGWGLLIYLALTTHSATQLLLSDYVQHYGLRRKIDANGRPEPVGPHHSWDSPHRASSAMMLNAPRHADHHAHPMRPYPALELQGRPLPRSLPVMATLAMFPKYWRKVMDPRVPTDT